MKSLKLFWVESKYSHDVSYALVVAESSQQAADLTKDIIAEPESPFLIGDAREIYQKPIILRVREQKIIH